MEYLFEDYPRELAKQIANDEPTKMYYALKGMSDLIDMFEWVEEMKEKYPSFCFYPEDFNVDVLFKSRYTSDIYDTFFDQITGFLSINKFGCINQIVMTENEIKRTKNIFVMDNTGIRFNIRSKTFFTFYFSDDKDREKHYFDRTKEN